MSTEEFKFEDMKHEPNTDYRATGSVRSQIDWKNVELFKFTTQMTSDLSIEDDIELLISLRAILDDLEVKTIVVRRPKVFKAHEQIADVMESEHVDHTEGASAGRRSVQAMNVFVLIMCWSSCRSLTTSAFRCMTISSPTNQQKRRSVTK